MIQAAKGMNGTKRELPPGWRWVRLGEVCRIFAGGAAPQGKDYFDATGPYFFRVSDLSRYGRTMALFESHDRLSAKALIECQLVMAQKGTVVFPKSGAAIVNNNRAVLSSDGYIVSHLIALEPSPVVLSEWLYHATCQLDMMDFSDNTGYPSLKQSSVARIEISLPPLAEQKRIAEILNEHMAAAGRMRDATEGQLDVAEALPAAYLRQAFPQPGQALPAGWRWVTLEDIKAREPGAIVSGPFGSNIGKRFFVDKGVPLIRGCNLKKGDKQFIESGFVFITEEKATELHSCTALRGDLIFTAAGTIGQVGLIPEDSKYEKYVISNKQLRARVDREVADPLFLFYWFSAPVIQRRLQLMKTGNSIPLITLGILRGLPIPLPNMIEQQRIVVALRKQMTAARKLRATLEVQQTDINALPAALLRRAFAGEL